MALLLRILRNPAAACLWLFLLAVPTAHLAAQDAPPPDTAAQSSLQTDEQEVLPPESQNTPAGQANVASQPNDPEAGEPTIDPAIVTQTDAEVDAVVAEVEEQLTAEEPIPTIGTVGPTDTPAPPPMGGAAPADTTRPLVVVPGVQLLTLDDAIELAVRQNADILRAVQDIESTYGLVLQVTALALPTLGVTSSFDQTQETLARGAANDKNWSVTVQVSQPLYTGGEVQANIRIAQLTRSNSYYALEETILSTIALVQKFFAEVLVNRALIQVQQQTIQLLERQLQDTRNRFEAGTVPRFDVLRAEVEVANAMPDLIGAENAYRLSRFRLANLLGINPGALDSPEPPVDVIGNLVTAPPPFDLREGLDYAHANRAVLRVQEQGIEIGREQIKAAQAGYLPTFAISGGLLSRNMPGQSRLDNVNSGWFFGVTGSWNIFDGFETRGLVEQARAQLETARINFAEAERNVAQEVQDAFSRLVEARALIESQEKNVEQAMEALELGEARFSAGAATQVEVLDARVALTRAQVTELEARFLYTLALIDIMRATAYNTRYQARLDDPLLSPNRDRVRRATIVREPAPAPTTSGAR